MKIKFDVEKISCEIGLTPTEKDGNESLSTETCISGEVHLTEGDLTMNLISEEDRKLLANCLRDGFVDFVLRMTGYSVVEEDEA